MIDKQLAGRFIGSTLYIVRASRYIEVHECSESGPLCVDVVHVDDPEVPPSVREWAILTMATDADTILLERLHVARYPDGCPIAACSTCVARRAARIH